MLFQPAVVKIAVWLANAIESDRNYHPNSKNKQFGQKHLPNSTRITKTTRAVRLQNASGYKCGYVYVYDAMTDRDADANANTDADTHTNKDKPEDDDKDQAKD